MSLLLALCGPAFASDQETERTRLNAERQMLTSRFAAEEDACQRRFAVTTCVDGVRLRRRAALAPLRERELRLDEAQRQERAQEREATRAAKRAALASSQTQTPAQKLAPNAASSPATGRAAPIPSAPRVTEAQRQQAAQTRAAQAAQRATDARRRNEEAKAAQAQVARRVAQRQAGGPLPAPLPRAGQETTAPAASPVAR